MLILSALAGMETDALQQLGDGVRHPGGAPLHQTGGISLIMNSLIC